MPASGRVRAALLDAPLRELAAHALRAAPHGHDLNTALAHLAYDELAVDPGAIELKQHAVDRLRRSRVPELVRAVDPPVPVAARVALGVALGEHHGGLYIAALVRDAQVELQVGPVARERVDDALEI
jgi:hypothetical protein